MFKLDTDPKTFWYLESVEIFSRQILICSQRICNMARALHCEDTSEICPILLSFDPLKGLVLQINFVLRSIKLNQRFKQAPMCFTCLECLVEEIKLYIQILIASVKLKSLPNFKGLVRMPPHNFCTSLPLCHWLSFSSIHPSCDAGKIRVNSPTCPRRLPDSGLIFQDHMRVPVSIFMVEIQSLWTGSLEGFIELVNNF